MKIWSQVWEALFFFNSYFIYFPYFFWLRRVLVAAHGTLLRHAGSFRVSLELWCAGFVSLVVARGLQGAWAL